MKSNYKPIGKHIRLVDVRNLGLKVTTLLGLSISKEFIPSVANTIGSDMENYKIIRKNQFACSLMQVRRDKKIPVALLRDFEEAIISQAYPVFEVIDEELLLPEYLMMWFSRSEFDREACFYAVGGVRGSLDWEDFCNMRLPIPHIDKQKEIVDEYNTIVNRIKLNEQLNQKLEETAQAIYKQWFVDFDFPDENGNPYKSSGGEMEYNAILDIEIPKNWSIGEIGNYSSVKSGYAFKSEWWRREGLPIIKIGSIQNHTVFISEDDYVDSNAAMLAKRYKASEGDIVIAMTGATIGKIAIVPALENNPYVNQRVGIFDLGKEPIKRAPYLFFSLIQEYVQNEIRNVGGDSAQENISNTQIEGIHLIIPDKSLIDMYNSICQAPMRHLLQKKSESVFLDKARNLLLSRMAARDL